MAHDYRTWAKTERDPEKVAKLKACDRCEALGRAAHRREVEGEAAKKTKRPARKRRRPRKPEK